MTDARANKQGYNPQHKIFSEYTWAELHASLLRGENLAKDYVNEHGGIDKPRMNRLLKDRFEGVFPINPQNALPYYVAFTNMSKKTAASIIPGFNKPIGILEKDGKYQSVVEIYDGILEATADGWDVSKSFVSRSKEVKTSSIKKFLGVRDYSLEDLIKRARELKKLRELAAEVGPLCAQGFMKQEVAADILDRLRKLEEKEISFKASLKNAAPKRNGIEALTNRQHLDPTLLAQGIVKRVKPLRAHSMQNSQADANEEIKQDAVGAANETALKEHQKEGRLPHIVKRKIPDYSKDAREMFALFPSINKTTIGQIENPEENATSLHPSKKSRHG